MPDQSEFEHAFIASAPDFRGTFRCAIAPPMRSLCSCKTALALGGAADDAVAANQCEYGPISVKVLVYTETAPDQTVTNCAHQAMRPTHELYRSGFDPFHRSKAEPVIGALSGSYWIPNSALSFQDMLGMKCSLVTVDETA